MVVSGSLCILFLAATPRHSSINPVDNFVSESGLNVVTLKHSRNVISSSNISFLKGTLYIVPYFFPVSPVFIINYLFEIVDHFVICFKFGS